MCYGVFMTQTTTTRTRYQMRRIGQTGYGYTCRGCGAESPAYARRPEALRAAKAHTAPCKGTPR